MRILILAVLTATLLITMPVAATSAKCTLGVCKGERVIIYDSQYRRTGTIENRGYGTKLQFRDNQNRITGYIDGQGRTYDANRTRTGTIGEPSGDTNKPWWR